jgi:hypothetical protein
VLLGRWREPESLEDGLAQLREVQAMRRTRVLEMGVLYREVLSTREWAEGYGSVGEMARSCDLDLRTLQRAKRLVESLDALPDTAAAVVWGEITLDDARKIASDATEDTEEEWLKTRPWYTEPDFSRIVELASRGVPILQVAVQPEPHRGIGKRKKLDRHRCRNPEDRRPTLQSHTHHKRWRSEGGGEKDGK